MRQSQHLLNNLYPPVDSGYFIFDKTFPEVVLSRGIFQHNPLSPSLSSLAHCPYHSVPLAVVLQLLVLIKSVCGALFYKTIVICALLIIKKCSSLFMLIRKLCFVVAVVAAADAAVVVG